MGVGYGVPYSVLQITLVIELIISLCSEKVLHLLKIKRTDRAALFCEVLPFDSLEFAAMENEEYIICRHLL